MKEKGGNNNVRSFEAYEKMMKEKKSKSKVVMNDENEVLTVRDNAGGDKFKRSNTSRGNLSKDTIKNNKSMESQSSVNNKHHRSSSKQQKPLSPNRHKNHNHSPMKTVPYSEIQLILQSIDSIQNKAKQEISQWSMKNKQLCLQNEKLRRQITRVKQSQMSLMQQYKNAMKRQQQLGEQYSRKQSDMLVKSRIWNEQKHQYIQEILNIKQANRLLQQQVGQMEGRLEEEVRNGEEWRERYDQLVGKLTAGKSERLAELIYQLQSKYSQCWIMDLIQQLQVQKLMLQKQCQKHKNQTHSSQQRCMQQKQQRVKLQHMLSNIMQENKKLIQSLSIKQNNFKEQKQSLKEQLLNERNHNQQTKITLQTQIDKITQKLQLQIKQNHNTIQHLQHTVIEKQHIIDQLKSTIDELQQNIQMLQQNIQMLQQTIQMKEIEITAQIQQKHQLQLHYKYFDVVDQQCQQLQDMTKILNKLQLIEKIKLQNQTNIQKIQFLTKMLDC